MEGKVNGPLVSGLGGVALLALFMSGPTTKSSTLRPTNPPSSASRLAEDTTQASTAVLDRGGPWAAICADYGTGAGSSAESSVISWVSDPPQSAPGASELVLKTSGEETKFPVHHYPVANLRRCVGSNAAVSTLIVALPDPVTSHLQLEFDRAIAAITRAAASQKFSLQRYWFPWSSAQSDSAEMRLRAAEERQLRMKQPGVLIFRNPEGKRAMVFVAGETPTGGVNRSQFSLALDYVGQIQPKGEDRILIAGPEFSGSYPGIADVLLGRGTTGKRPAYIFYSPSTSSDVLMSDFRQKMSTEDRLVTFEIPDSQAKRELLLTLRNMGYRESQIALLAEDESAYGNEMSLESGSAGIQVLSFPRDLSVVRNALEDQSIDPESQRPLGTIPSVRLSLHDDIQNEHDAPPEYAREQSAADLDRELQNIVWRIRQERIQAVILLATNPLDRIFLLDYLHRVLPDVRLATFGADALMLGRPKFVDLSGTLTVTGLPLLSNGEFNTADSGPASMVQQFRSNSQQGMFLAVASLLKLSENLESHGLDPNSSAEPCAVVSIVGKSSFELVTRPGYKTTYPCNLADATPVARMEQKPTGVSWNWLVFLIVLGLTTSAHGIYTLFNAFSWLARASFALIPASITSYLRLPLYWVHDNSKYAPDKIFFLFVVTNQLLILEYMGVTASWALSPKLLSPVALLTFVHMALMLGMIALDCALVLKLRLLKLESKAGYPVGARKAPSAISQLKVMTPAASIVVERRRSEVNRHRWNLGVSVIYVITTILVWQLVLSGNLGFRHIFSFSGSVAHRCTQLLNGLSPLAAIAAILAGYGLWALIHLRRITFIETRRVHLSFSKLEAGTPVFRNPSAQRVEDLHCKLHMALDHPEKNKVPLEVGFLLGGAVLLRIWSVLAGIDGRPLMLWSALWGFALLLTVLLSSFQQNWIMWRRLKSLLQFINGTPLRDMFRDLPKDLSSMRIWRMGGSRRSFLLQKRTIEVMRQIKPAALALAAAQGGSPGVARPSRQDVYDQELRALHATILASERDEEEKTIIDWLVVGRISDCLNVRLPEAQHLLEFANSRDALPGASDRPLATYVALRFVSLIRYSLLQIRNMLWFSFWGFICLLVSVSVYPFQGRHSLGSLLSLVFLGLLLGTGAMLAQMDRDPVLGMLEFKEHPGQTNVLGITGKLLSVGGVPLLAVLASQFPALADFLSSWVRPIFESIR